MLGFTINVNNKLTNKSKNVIMQVMQKYPLNSKCKFKRQHFCGHFLLILTSHARRRHKVIDTGSKGKFLSCFHKMLPSNKSQTLNELHAPSVA